MLFHKRGGILASRGYSKRVQEEELQISKDIVDLAML